MEEGGSRIRAVQMDNLRSVLGNRRMDRVPNTRKRELSKVTKGVNERIDESVFWWFGMWRGWRMIGLLMVVSQWVCH